MDYNYQLHPYSAVCLQWTGSNSQEICGFIENSSVFREQFIVIRHQAGMNTLNIGDWVVKGEDGALRFYTKEVFPSKYRPIAGGGLNSPVIAQTTISE